MVVERTASFGKLHLKGIVASVGSRFDISIAGVGKPSTYSACSHSRCFIVLGKRSDAGPNYGHAVYGATAHHELL